MTINNFMGGMNNRLAPQLLQDSAAQYLENSDLSTGVLKSIKELKSIDKATDDIIVYNYGKYVFFKKGTVATTIGNIIYSTNSDGCIQKTFEDGKQYNLIIEGPKVAIEVEANTTAGEITGNNIKYCYTYYGAKDGSESAPSPFSANIVIGNGTTDKGQVTLKAILASDDPQVTHIRIYRIGHTLTSYSLVATLPNQNSNIVDQIDDSSATIKLSTYGFNLTSDKTSGPYNTTYIANYGGSLFVASSNNNNKVYYSQAGRPDLWGEGYILLDEEVIAISPVSVGLIVACKTKTYILYGDVGNFSKQLLLPSVGCSGNSMLPTAIGVIWFYKDTIWNFYQAVTELSKLKFKVDGEVISACATEQCAYFLLDTGKILVINYALNLSMYLYDAKGIKSITIGNGELLLCEGKNVYTFSGGDSTMQYISKHYVDGGVTLYKNYKTIYVYTTGEFDMETYINDNLVATTKLKNGLTEVKVDQTKRTGYYLWFKITGKGVIQEIQWICERRQNGR